MDRAWRVAVVGGGITGMAAAVRLRDRAPAGTEITVYEQSSVLGGKLLTGELAGSTVELGAESFLLRGPTGADSAAVALARRVGLAADIVHPTVGQAALAIDGTLAPMPRGTMMGVPGDLDAVAAVARPTAEADRDTGQPLLGPNEDVTVGALVRSRLGDEVVDRLVDPMLGGVYAGRADNLSLVATMPALARTARVEHTLTGAVRALQSGASRRPAGPFMGTVAGGISRLVEAAAQASGARIRRDTPVRELTPTASGWRLVVGPADAPELVEVDAVLLALQARPAARLLTDFAMEAAKQIGDLEYASAALIGLAIPETALPELSGFLVPATEGLLTKAATFFTNKWGHLRRPDGVVLIRASVGRYGEEQQLQRGDDELVATVHAELSKVLGVSLPTPLDSYVQRWVGSLPQYAPGHLDRVATARSLLTAYPTLALAGAGYDGVGIPLCITSGEAGAEAIVKALEQSAV